MSEQSPEIVAAASLSPLSPKPISVQIQSNSVVPMLQDQAATTDTAALNPADFHQSEPMTGIIMDPGLENHSASAPVSDTIVVAGDSSDFHDDSDGSIDYGDEDETQGNVAATADGAADAAPDNDEYAKSFDSPPVDAQSSNSEAGSGELQPDVSEEAAPSNSMNEQVTSAPAVPSATQPHSNSLAVAPLEDGPPPPTSSSAEQPNANGSPTLMPGDNEPPSTTTSSGPPNPLSPTSTLPTPAPKGKSDAFVDTGLATAGPPMQDPASIQKLVDDITARASATDAAPTTSLLSGPHPSSLPPKPVVSAQPQSYSRGPPVYGHPLTPTDGGLMRSYNQSSHATSRNSYDMEPSAPGQGPASGFGGSAWETFLAEEKQYTSEQNWDKFPEGSRVFVGNLSSDRVSKQQVFAVFSKYGRLAQISMKSAYGFIQYHTVSEAQAALEACRDMEIGGRRIHLEISRRQTKKPSSSGDNRGHSPERRPGPRGPANDRFDSNSRRNDFRRSASPRRDNSRGFYPRDRDNGPMPHDRRRSRSPPRRDRFGSNSDAYRRRSPSPYHRRTPSELDIAQRYGSAVPDIQILLMHDVDRPFVTWVENALRVRGLTTDVMHLNPRFPRETIVQRLVIEGVHAIIDLDRNSPLQARVNLQLFIRNTNTNIKFENYSQLDPPIAAELILREKSKAAVQARPPPIAAQSAYAPTYQSPAVYQPPVIPSPPPAATGYPHHQQHSHYAPLPQAVPPPVPQAAAAAPPTVPAALPDLSKVDNDTLRTILAGLQAQPHQAQHAAAAAVPQIDINALLGSLQNAAPQQYGAPPPQAGYYSGVPPPPAAGQNNAGGNNAHIQNIMENLKRASGGK
ncbi:hypothetical protein QBC40DRAFT_20322 [Triangularia verruculosa]|uniref:RRM domain-containing protein n=1 Tax=Triangularia verruculosa TaxID=2587418 RepID=A0AAN7AYD0_9PEZI|nr:hypothetical protein QBC40DRAFT_20322 [Triangularia verruculosa]